MDDTFVVGHTYQNRTGRYTVLAIRGDILDVRYEDGTKASLSIEMQKRIITNMSKHDTIYCSTRRATSRKEAFTHPTIDWTRYDTWNQLLFDLYFNADATNRLVYIDIDDEELTKLMPGDKPGTSPLKDFAEAVLKTLDLRRGHLLDSHFRRLLSWRAKGANPPPPFIAVLVLFCLVAQRMKTDETFHANNYYDRLAELLLGVGYKKQKREDIRIGFERAQELWHQLENWLISQDGRFGLPSARPMYGLSHVGYPISQALLRAHDRQKLPEFFWSAGLEPQQEVPPADMERLMTYWIPSSSLSQAAKTSWNNNAARRRMAEVAGLELSTWNGSIPIHEIDRHITFTAPIAVEVQICGGPRPQLLWGITFRVPSGASEVTYEAMPDAYGLPMNGKYEKSVKVIRGLEEQWSQPVEGISIADFLVTRISMIASDNKSRAEWQPRKVLVLTWNDELKLYRSQKHLKFGLPGVVLAYKTIANRVFEVLASVDAGAMKQVPDSWGIPEDWVAFTDVQLARIPDVDGDTDLEALVPEIWSSVNWDGGLALPGRRRWLASRLPTISINSIEEVQRLAATIHCMSVLDNVEAQPAPISFGIDGNALDIDLASHNLTEGAYSLNVTTSRSGRKDMEDITRQTFEIRSPDSPLNLFPKQLGYRSDLPCWTISAGLLEANKPDKGTISITGASVSPERSKPTPVVDIPDTLEPDARTEQEDLIGTGHILKRTVGEITDCFNGAHYWIIEPVNDLAGFYRAKSGVCKYCGLRQKFYPFRIIDLLSRQSTRTRREPSIAGLPTARLMTSANDKHVIDFDGLLDACFTLGGGTWFQFELLARQVCNDPAFSYEAIQLFAALGHIDVQLNQTNTHPSQWKVAPSLIMRTGSEKVVLSGYRSPRLLRKMKKVVEAMGGNFSSMSSDHGPTAYLITGMNNESLTKMLETVNSDIRTGFSLALSPDVSIASQLAPLHTVLSAARTLTPPITAEAFDILRASWIKNRPVDKDGLYRSDSMPRTYILQRKGVCYQVSYRVGKHLAAAFANKGLLAYNVNSQELECPLGAQVPGLYERAAVLSSGLPPIIDLGSSKVIYSQVPREVASAIWIAIYKWTGP